MSNIDYDVNCTKVQIRLFVSYDLHSRIQRPQFYDASSNLPKIESAIQILLDTLKLRWNCIIEHAMTQMWKCSKDMLCDIFVNVKVKNLHRILFRMTTCNKINEMRLLLAHTTLRFLVRSWRSNRPIACGILCKHALNN